MSTNITAKEYFTNEEWKDFERQMKIADFIKKTSGIIKLKNSKDIFTILRKLKYEKNK